MLPKEPTDRRAAAREAMEGPERAKERKQAAQLAEEKRARARLAMEPYEYRHKQEERKRAEAEALIRQKKLAEDLAKKKVAEEAERQAAAAAEEATAAERERLHQVKVMKLKEGEQEIEEIKKDPHVAISSLRTLKTDVVRAVEEDHLSMAQMAIRERERKLLFEQKNKPTSQSGFKFTIGITVAVLIIAAGIYLWFNLPTAIQRVNQAPVTPQVPSLIFAESHREVDTTMRNAQGTINYLRLIRDSKTTANELITNIYFTGKTSNASGKALLGLRPALASAGIVLPPPITQFSDETFMLGVHRGDRNSYFLILKTRFYENMAHALLTDEHTVANVLMPLFSGYALPRDLQGKTFAPAIIQNTDVRVLKESATSTPLIIYGFIDRNTLVITETEAAFKKVHESYFTPAPVVQ